MERLEVQIPDRDSEKCNLKNSSLYRALNPTAILLRESERESTNYIIQN